MRTKFAIQIGICAPVIGWIALRPIAMPCLSMVSSDASEVSIRRHSSMNAATAGFSSAASDASGCPVATAMYVAPHMVSGRVVNTVIGSPPPAGSKSNSTPSERPIQLRCIVFTASGQPMLSSPARSSST